MAVEIVWEWIDRPGLEHLMLEVAAGAVEASGLVLVRLGPDLIKVSYRIELDGGWLFRRARLSVERDGIPTALEIERSADGRWTVDGQGRPDLAGCIDIDIMATPFTNTLPIRRLEFGPGEARVIQVAYIRLPQPTVEAAAQEYARLDAASPPTRFRYRSLASGFTADLTVDGEGLVTDYPGIWRRRSAGR